MKILAAVLALTISTGVMAHGFQLNVSGLTTFSTIDSTAQTSGNVYKAQVLLNDTQEAMQSGKISVFLAQQIKEVQSVDSEVSEFEAIEILAAEATEILK